MLSVDTHHPLFAIVIAVVFGLYLPTVFLGIPGGDSGELVAEACQLGVAHPPGYPFFVYFARSAIEFLPAALGSPAWRVNAACAALGAVSAALLAVSTLRLSRRTSPDVPEWVRAGLSAAAAIAWAMSPLIWLYNVGAEVFALSNFFVALLVWSFAAYGELAASPNAEPASLIVHARYIAFFCGLALTNQHTNILLALPLAGWVAASLSRVLCLPRLGANPSERGPFSRVRQATLTISNLCFFFALGLLPYAHLPIAHMFWRGPGSWGDASTVSGFIAHFLRSDYGTFRLYARDGYSEGALERTMTWARDLSSLQLPFIWTVPLTVGVFSCLFTARHLAEISCGKSRGVKSSSEGPGSSSDSQWRSEYTAAMSTAAAIARTAPGALVLFTAFYFAVFHSLSNMPLKDPLLFAVHARFWMQPNTLLFPMTALGASAGLDMASKIIESLCSKRVARIAHYSLNFALAFVVFSSLKATHSRNVKKLDNSRNDVMDRYGRALLEPLPKNAMLITSFDMQWTAARYLQTCERVRPDIILLNAPVSGYAWFAAQRRLYESAGAVFPGTHLVTHMTAPHAQGGFSFLDLFVANDEHDCGATFFESYQTDPPHALFANTSRAFTCSTLPRGGVFFSGSLVGGSGSGKRADKQEAFHAVYDVIPHGIVSTARRRSTPVALTSWRNTSMAAPSAVNMPSERDVARARRAWVDATSRYDGVIDAAFYDASTWERATRIDFWNQAVTHATWLLEWALSAEAQAARASPRSDESEDSMDVETALEAASILEQSIWMMVAHGERPVPATLKNLGLVYVRLVRSKRRLARSDEGDDEARGFPLLPELRATLNQTGHEVRAPTWSIERGFVTISQWRTMASERVLHLWSKYLKTKESRSDPGRSSIENVVSVLKKAKEQK